MKTKRRQQRNKPSYSKLEARQLLAADFSLVGGTLTLDQFVDSSATQANNLIVEDAGFGDLSFTLTDGTWNGVTSAGVTVAGSVLTVDDFALSDVVINSTTSDQFDIVFGNLNFSGDIRIDNSLGGVSFGSVTQLDFTSIDVGNSFFEVTGAQAIDLQSAQNDFDTIEIANASSATIFDGNDLTVLGATVTNQLQLRAGAEDGIAGSGAGGELFLDGNITAGNEVLLQASEGVTQASGVIVTDHLFLGGDSALESSGLFLLDQENQVNVISSDLSFDLNAVDSTLVFTNVQDLTVVSGTFVSVFDSFEGESFLGLSLGDDLDLNVIGSLGQTTGAFIVGGSTDLEVTQDVGLQDVDLNFDGIDDNSFGSNPDVDAGGNIAFSSALDAQSLNAGGILILVEDGTLTITPDLVAAGGNLGFSAGSIFIDADINANQLLLQADDGVQLVAGNALDVNDLLLIGEGNFDLVPSLTFFEDNTIDNLVANIVGSLSLSSSGDLAIEEFVSAGNQAANFSGVAVVDTNFSGDSFFDLQINDGGDLIVNEEVFVGGNLVIEADDITALIDADLVGGSVTIDADGDVSLGSVISTSGQVTVNSNQDLDVLNVVAAGDVELFAEFSTFGDGILSVGNVQSGGTVVIDSIEGIIAGDVCWRCSWGR